MIETMNKIEDFLSKCKSESTKLTYGSHLNKFFKTINAEPNTYFNTTKTHKAYEKDVEKYWKSLKDRPPMTTRCAICTVKKFFMENDINLKPEVWKTISNKTKGSRAITKIMVPTRQQLKELLGHGDAKSRALFFVLLSSGMTISEACKIKLDDVKLTEEPVRIIIKKEHTRNRKQRNVFISDEAAGALKEWLKIRKKYLVKMSKIVNERFKNYHKSSNDDRVFPFTPTAAMAFWHKSLNSAKYAKKDKQTKRYRMPLHCLRTYFKDNMSLKIPVDVVEYFMGYESYLTNSYDKYKNNPKQLAEMYQKGMNAVSIFEIPADVTKIEELQKQFDNQLLEKDKQIADMKAEIQEMKTRILELSTENNKK